MYSSTLMGNLHEVLNFNWLFLKLITRFICNEQSVLPVNCYGNQIHQDKAEFDGMHCILIMGLPI